MCDFFVFVVIFSQSESDIVAVATVIFLACAKSDIRTVCELWEINNAHLFKAHLLTVCAYSGLEAQGADRIERHA